MATTPDSHAGSPGFKSLCRPTKIRSPSTPITRLQVAKMRRQERGHVGWRTLKGEHLGRHKIINSPLFPGRGPPAPLRPGPSPVPPPAPVLRPRPPVQAVLRGPAADGAAGDIQRAVNKQDLAQARDTGQDAEVGLLICKKNAVIKSFFARKTSAKKELFTQAPF